MKFMLDTNICIAIIKRQPPRVLQRMREYHAGDIGISWVTLAELEYGAAKSRQVDKNRSALEEFILQLEVAALDTPVTRVYGELRANLELRGMPIGPVDMMIAAHALALDVTLVTNNTREFSRVAGLRVDDWLQ